jgi:hypothetical protein
VVLLLEVLLDDVDVPPPVPDELVLLALVLVLLALVLDEVDVSPPVPLVVPCPPVPPVPDPPHAAARPIDPRNKPRNARFFTPPMLVQIASGEPDDLLLAGGEVAGPPPPQASQMIFSSRVER